MSERDDFERFLRGIAEKYRKKGYRVAVKPGREDVPAFLRRTSPDLLASRSGEHVVVGVKKLGIARGDFRLRRLADLMQHRPGWRFDIVLYEPEVSRELRLPSERVIKRSLDQAENLFGQGDHAAALLLAWSTFEAAARRALRDLENGDVGRRVPVDLLKTLVSSGLLTEDDYRQLVAVAQRRNEIAHGELQSSVPRDLLVHLKKATARLLDGLVPAPA